MVVRICKVSIGALALLLASGPVSARAQSFVYAAVAGTNCTVVSSTSPPTCSVPPAVAVIDASTGAVVTTIPLSGWYRPSLLTVSRDGTRLYVMNSTLAFPAVLSVIDLQRHRLLAAHTFNSPPACDYVGLAVDRDPDLLYLRRDCGDPRVTVFDARSGLFGATTFATPNHYLGGVAPSILPGRFFMTTWFAPTASSVATVTLNEHDGGTGFVTSSLPLGVDVADAWSLLLSSDASRLFVVTSQPRSQTVFRPELIPWTGRVLAVDPQSMITTGFYEAPGRLPRRILEAAATRRLYVFDTAFTDLFGYTSPFLQVFDTDTHAIVQSVAGNPGFLAISPDGKRAYGPGVEGTNTVVTWDLGTLTSIASTAVQADPTLIVTTPPGVAACSYRLNVRHSPWRVHGGHAPITLSTACAWKASSSAPWARLDAIAGDSGTTLTLSVDPNFTTTNRSGTVTIAGQLVTVSQAGFGSARPFGVIDTPAENASAIAGSLPITGWALDDVGVTRLQILRDPAPTEPQTGPIFVGEATFVDGSRPDVQGVFPAFPNSARAGWGLMVLTNMLPYGGNGSVRFHAYADDAEGQRTLLGSRTVTCANATSMVPFGTIDTPGQGEAVSGTIVNFGWALTPSGGVIPLDGSTIDVVIDGVVVGRPVYNNPRSDIAALFPGYTNSTGPVGYFHLDTRPLANGVHTIAWVVRDSAGHAAGIGSRYFTVFNP